MVVEKQGDNETDWGGDAKQNKGKQNALVTAVKRT